MSATSTDLITARNVRKRFGAREVLRDIDLTVPAGSITVILGTNGAGKTTLLRILGLLEPADEGTVAYDTLVPGVSTVTYGASTRSPAQDQRYLPLRRQMLLAFQHPAIFSGSVLSNVTYGLQLRGMSRGRHRRERAPACFVAFRRRSGTPVGGTRPRPAAAPALP
jgi:ABC-type Fe3+/spermidine/putrescine transport system ATPase subunit